MGQTGIRMVHDHNDGKLGISTSLPVCLVASRMITVKFVRTIPIFDDFIT